MTSEFSIHVNSEALIERGYNFLMIEDYQRAYDYFDRALDVDAKAHTAYWGMMLAERQCKNADGSDLIKVGICIDTDQNYYFACQYADDAERAQYEKTARMCERMCHIILIELICKKRMRPAQLRAKHYAKSSFADRRLIDIHNSLLCKNAMTNPAHETPGALIALLEMYQDDSTFSKLDRDLHFFNKVKDLYREYMDRLLQEIVFYKTPYQKAKEEFDNKYKTKDNNERKNTATLPNIAYGGSFYSDLTYYHETQKLVALMFKEQNLYSKMSLWYPCEETKKGPTEQELNAQLWVKPCEKDSVFIGYDGKPSNIGERWRYLAKFLPDSNGARIDKDFVAMILGFYDNAIKAGANPDLCVQEKKEYFDRIISKLNYIALRQFRDIAPDKRRVDCKVLEKVLHDQKQTFIRLQKEAEEERKKIEDFIEKNKRIQKKRSEWLQYMIEKSIDDLKKEVNSFQNTLTENKKETDLFMKALSESASSVDEDYKNYAEEVKRVNKVYADEIKKYNEYILQLRKYCTILSQQSRKPFVRYIDLK